MAHRGFFGYEPYVDPLYGLYDYAAAAAPAPYTYPCDVYYQLQPSPSRTRTRTAPRETETETSFSIPIHGPDSDPEPEPEPERKRERKTAAPAAAMSAEEAAVRVQAAARGLLARRSVRAVREVEREAGQVLAKVASEAGALALLADVTARAAVGEALMRMLLRLDAVRGARVYRRRITKRVLALQDHVDALEASPVGEVAEADDADTPEATAVVEVAEESAVATEIPDAAERGGEMEDIKQTEVDGEVAAAGEPEAEAGEEKEAVACDANNVDVVDDEPEDSDAEGDWEMVTEENEQAAPVAAATSDDDQEPPRKEPAACPFETSSAASAGAASDGVDVAKVMQMVTALCEQSAQQCALIGALAERVDALEHTVRRMAEQKLSTEAK